MQKTEVHRHAALAAKWRVVSLRPAINRWATLQRPLKGAKAGLSRRRTVARSLMTGRWLSFYVVLLLVLCAGCAVTPPPPPQQLIQSGHYNVAETTKALQTCGQRKDCDVTLFNLGLAHVSSPARNLSKAFQCFDKISRAYPQSPWVYQARAWMRLLSEQRTLEAQHRKLQADLRTSEEKIRDLRKLQADLRTSEEEIRDLRGRLDGSRTIDIEMEKKERELLR